MTSASSAAGEAEAERPRIRKAFDRLSVPGVIATYMVVAVLVALPVWTSPQSSYVGVSADPQQTMWFFTWTSFALGHLHNPLISTYMNYPAGFNLMWQTWVPLAGVLLWPVTLIWGPVASYNIVVTGATALGAVTAFFAIRRFIPRTIPAAIGALIYGFSPFVIGQSIGHAHMVASAVTPPLALLLLDELLVRQRLSKAGLAAMITALGVAQFFIAEEVFASEIIVAVIVTSALALSHRSLVRARLDYAVRVIAIAAAVVAVLIAVPVGVQLFGPNHITGPPIHSPDIYVTDAFNLIFPTAIQWLAPDAVQRLTGHFTGNLSEWNGYIGLPLLAILVVTLWRNWRVSFVRVTGLSAIAVTVLSLGPHLHGLGRSSGVPLPWLVISNLPLLKNLQPNRLMLYTFLGVGIGLAFVLWQLTANRKRVALAAAICAVSLVPLIPTVPLASTPLTLPAFFTTPRVNVIPDGAIAVTAPWSGGPNPAGLSWQFASNMRFRVLGGYILGTPSSGATTLHNTIEAISSVHSAPSLDASLRTRLLDEIQSNDVQVVIAGPAADQPVFVAFFTNLFGSAPQVEGDVDLWFPAIPSR